MDNTWESHKDTIKDLFIRQKLPLNKVMDIMKVDYNFSRGKAQYERRLRDWGLRKNMTRNEQKYVRQVLTLRGRNDKTPIILFNEEILDAARLQRMSRRLRPPPRFVPLADTIHQVAQISTPNSIKIGLSPPPMSYTTAELLESLPCVCFSKSLVSDETFRPNITSLISDAIVILDEGLETTATWDMMFPRRRSDLHQLLLTTILGMVPVTYWGDATKLYSLICGIYPVALSSEFLPRRSAEITQSDSHAAHFHLLVYLFSNSMLYDTQSRDLLDYIDSYIEEKVLTSFLSTETFTTQALGEKLLQLAVKFSRLWIVRTCLRSGISARAFDESNSTLIQVAVSRNDISITRILSDYGASVSAARKGMTPLQSASRHGNIELVKLLLGAGADVNQMSTEMSQSFDKYSFESELSYEGVPGAPLESAAASGHLDTYEYLLEAGANPSSEEPRTLDLFLTAGFDPNSIWPECNRPECISGAQSPLLQANRMRSIETVDKLPRAGANINLEVEFVWSALHGVLDLVYTDILSHLLCNRGYIHFTTKAHELLLQVAAARGKLDIVDSLLKGGIKPDIDVDTLGRYGFYGNPLAEAAYHSSIDVVRRLLQAGADVNAPGTRTPLQAASASLQPSIVIIDLLIEAGANVNGLPAERYGVTALQAAAIKGHIGIAVRLLEAGADVNAAGSRKRGRTALEGAAEHGRIDMVQLLLNAGAGYAPNNGSLIPQFERALDLARHEGHMAEHDLIKSHFGTNQKR